LRKYWTKKDALDAKRAKTFEELAEIALRIIDRIPRPVEMICGPLTSGGLGSFEKNLKVLKKYILLGGKSGLNIFDQMPFEPHLHRIWEESAVKDPNELLESFYGTIFKSRKIKQLDFVPDWRGSIGARWERKTARKLKIKIADIV